MSPSQWHACWNTEREVYRYWKASLVAQLVKNLPVVQETWVQFRGGEDPLKKEMVIHSSILAWRILRTEEPGRWKPTWLHELDTTQQLRASQAVLVEKTCLPMQEIQEMQVQIPAREDPLEEEMAPHSRILAWRIPGAEEPDPTVHRVTQSQTRLKRLSTNSN